MHCGNLNKGATQLQITLGNHIFYADSALRNKINKKPNGGFLLPVYKTAGVYRFSLHTLLFFILFGPDVPSCHRFVSALDYHNLPYVPNLQPEGLEAVEKPRVLAETGGAALQTAKPLEGGIIGGSTGTN